MHSDAGESPYGGSIKFLKSSLDFSLLVTCIVLIFLLNIYIILKLSVILLFLGIFLQQLFSQQHSQNKCDFFTHDISNCHEACKAGLSFSGVNHIT